MKNVRSWQLFSNNIRCVVGGARIVSEILYGVLYDDSELIKSIYKENYKSKTIIRKFMKSLLKLSKNISGRIVIHRLLQEYQFEASWPTDDISMRKLFEAYRNGELQRRLPEVEARITSFR